MLTLEQLQQLIGEDPDAFPVRVREFSIDGRDCPFNSRPHLMGVINLSPGSWYRESVSLSTDRAIERGLVLRAQGADWIDIGAESTLAHTERVEGMRQKSRLLPVVEALAQQGCTISVETYEPAVVRAVLEAGANIINLTGSHQDFEMAALAREHNAAIILCHVQGNHVRNVGDFQFGDDTIVLMEEYFKRRLDLFHSRGVEKLLLDPGLGFYYGNLQDSSRRIRHQMRTLLQTFRLRKLGFPLCHALPHAFELFGEEVRSAEAFFAVLALLGRTDVLRTHEIPKVRAVMRSMQLYDDVAG